MTMWELGLLIGLATAALIGLPIFLIRNSRNYHDRCHVRYSELMCDHCQLRRKQVPLGEALRRWPMRILGSRPPEGTG